MPPVPDLVSIDDHSRVVLSVKDTDAAGSDYINACHMAVSNIMVASCRATVDPCISSFIRNPASSEQVIFGYDYIMSSILKASDYFAYSNFQN